MIRSLLALLLCIGSQLPSLAQSEAATEDRTITAMERQLCEAWAQRDFSRIEPALDKEFVLLTEEAGMGRTEVLDQLKSVPQSTCTIIGSDVKAYAGSAWAYSSVVFESTSHAEQRALADMWIRSGDGRWRLVFRHSTKQDPISYLNHALDLMEANSIWQKDFDWKKLRSETLARSEGAEILADTYEAIRFALYSLGDHHSHLQLQDELQAIESKRRAQRKTRYQSAVEAFSFKTQNQSPFASREKPQGELLQFRGNSFALVVVPRFSPESDEQGVRFETQLQGIIAELDSQHPKGWIVDLRGNLGGNVWPMLAGIGPLLSVSENIGEGVSNNGRSTNYYRDGVAGYVAHQNNGHETTFSYPRVGIPAYKLAEQPRIAVLVDRSTASSGEITAIAFKGRSNTRFFGEHTLGATTITKGWTMIDGANPVIAVGVAADRQGNSYPDGIEPDVRIPVGKEITSSNQDPVMQAAMLWLSK